MSDEAQPLGRRTFLAGAVAAAAAAACSSGGGSDASATSNSSAATTASPAASNAPDLPSFVSTGPRDRQQVALTFHVSGDRSQAVRLLDLLHAHGTTITAFIVGTWLDANTDMAARFRNDGHELANHTYTHPTFPSLTRAAMANEVSGCRDVLVRLAGTGGRFFRPSGTTNGTDTPSPTALDVARAAGYPTVVGFDVDPADYQDPGAKIIARRTIDAVQPGSIVSLHFGHPGTVDALPDILAALDARGLRTVDVSTLLTA